MYNCVDYLIQRQLLWGQGTLLYLGRVVVLPHSSSIADLSTALFWYRYPRTFTLESPHHPPQLQGMWYISLNCFSLLQWQNLWRPPRASHLGGIDEWMRVLDRCLFALGRSVGGTLLSVNFLSGGDGPQCQSCGVECWCMQ